VRSCRYKRDNNESITASHGPWPMGWMWREKNSCISVSDGTHADMPACTLTGSSELF
jgi:hypothetical protein